MEKHVHKPRRSSRGAPEKLPERTKYPFAGFASPTPGAFVAAGQPPLVDASVDASAVAKEVATPDRARLADGEQEAAANRMEDEGGPPSPISAPALGDPGRISSSAGTDESVASRNKAGRTPRVALTVDEVMTKQVRTATVETPIKDVALLMAAEGIGAVPVVESDNHLLGLITDRDIVIRVCAGDKGIDDIRAGDAMTTKLTGIARGETIANALNLMSRLQVHRLPVVDEHFRLVGMLSIADVASRGDARADVRQALAEISNRKSFWSRI